jgi:hypothetical protein
MRRADPLVQLVGRALQGVLAIQLLATLVQGEPLLVFVVLAALLVSLSPVLARREWHAQLPIESQIVVATVALAVIFASDLLGQLEEGPPGLHFIAHAGSGLVLGVVAILVAVDMLGRRRLRVTPFLAATYSVALGIAAITVLEICEYVVEMARQEVL